MDKRQLIGISLIMVLLFGWMYFQQPNEVKKNNNKSTDSAKVVKSLDNKANSNPITMDSNATSLNTDSIYYVRKFGPTFAKFSKGNEQLITVESDLYKAVISNKGGAIKSFELKKFKKWDHTKAQLIKSSKGELFINFVTFEGVSIDSRDLYFEFTDNQNSEIKLSGKETFNLVAKLNVGPNQAIVKKITFAADKYLFNNKITLENLENIIPARGYNLVWEDGIRYQEKNSVDESSSSHVLVNNSGAVEEIKAEKDKKIEKSINGTIDYAGIKTKYFGVGFIPKPTSSYQGTVDVNATSKHFPNNGFVENYYLSFRVPYKGGVQTKEMDVYLGPLDYHILEPYGLTKMVNLGWKYGIRQIGEYFMMPIINFIHKYISNYGIAIIIFSIIMKFLLYPLSVQQMKSAQKMKLLQPEIQKLRDKFKDDNTKVQTETMKLYSEYGINPAGGCLPLLLQMPILMALWQVLSNTIDLRQAHFWLWMNDLSRPDIIFHFGTSIMGISFLSGLSLLMGITMLIQQKMTITDPNQKAMVYMMPVMFTLMFANLPSGLNLYYFVFNLIGIVQQIYINKFSSSTLSLAEMKKSPKKEGFFQKKIREAQEMAEAQGRTIPGKNNNQIGRQNQKKKK